MTITESTRFWSFKHKPGRDANEDSCKDFILEAIKNNYASMQYEYGSKIEPQNMVTLNWKSIIQIQAGDIIFLRGDERIYAVGQAIKPRISSDIVLEAKKIIANKSHDKYNSREYFGIVHFSDSDVFYENLDGEENWGQRIDVDSWQYYCPEGVPAKSQDLYIDGQTEYGVLKELKADKGIQTINELLKKMGIITELKTLLASNHNLILTGAPGTGKTYLAKQLARLLLFGKKDSSELSEEEQVSFDEHCGFVQFHPSYDYTDFVEGLRPNVNVNFERRDGVFKAFCKKAILSESADEKTMTDINSNPTVWKVSLEGTGDNPTRKDCMENGYIRIGWHEYGDIEDFNDYEDYFVGGKSPLRAFQNGMQIGDLVVSCYTAKEIDAVGIVTGDYEYRAEGNSYPRYRSVRWLVKNIRENIVEQNKGKTFTLSTVYKTNITAEAALKIVQKHVGTSKKVGGKDNYVFIIDEINRGEISKIFGELFFSIDPGYRGKNGKVKTQYQNMVGQEDVFYDGFYIPENVYIIGTMNDIDRSVESMDFAFRRRFAFKEITAEESKQMLYSDSSWGKDEAGKSRKPQDDVIKDVIQRMDNVNNMIWHNAKDGESEEKKCIDGLSSAYHIGASYFLKLVNYKKEDGSFDYDKLWDNHLEGLLFEYMRGMPSARANIKRLAKEFGYTNMSKYE